MVHEPRLIILDEPLTGLDAVSARHVKGLLQQRVAAGCTVIMTTHILEVAERMADRIANLCLRTAGVTAATVTVDKPEALHNIKAAAVEIRRRKS